MLHIAFRSARRCTGNTIRSIQLKGIVYASISCKFVQPSRQDCTIPAFSQPIFINTPEIKIYTHCFLYLLLLIKLIVWGCHNYHLFLSIYNKGTLHHANSETPLTFCHYSFNSLQVWWRLQRVHDTIAVTKATLRSSKLFSQKLRHPRSGRIICRNRGVVNRG